MVDLSRELRKEKKYADVLRVLRTGGAERNRELYYQELDALFAEWNDSGIMLDFYGEAYKHDPNDPRICLRLARTYRLIRDYEHSREYFRKTLDLQPGNPEAAEGIRNADYFLNITK
jgi:Tetratricopeptide repeat.